MVHLPPRRTAISRLCCLRQGRRLDVAHLHVESTELHDLQIDMFFGNASDLVPQAESGKVTILGVATPQRMKQLANVPAISETYPDMSLTSWNGFLVPAKTPQEIINKLARHVIAAARDPANAAQLTTLGIEANGTTPEEFVAQISREQPQFDAAIKAANLKPE
jgi:tripartite-type tricarboxylate transporter receptor subunit TctC